MRPNPALAGAALIPHAAVRTAGAVRDLSDSSLIVRLTQGRSWIGLLCVLLGGIVALNVISLSLNAGSGRISQQVAELERSNSALRGELAEELSASRVEQAAAGLGLATPKPEEVAYLDAGDGDLERLLSKLEDGTLLTGAGPVPSINEESSYATSTPTTTPAPVASSPAPSASPEAPSPTPSPAPAPPSGGVGL